MSHVQRIAKYGGIAVILIVAVCWWWYEHRYVNLCLDAGGALEQGTCVGAKAHMPQKESFLSFIALPLTIAAVWSVVMLIYYAVFRWRR